MKPRTTVYVTQYGGWWAFTERQWAAWLKAAAPDLRADRGYSLPDERMLRRRPACARREDPESRSWWPDRNGVTILQPLDWTAEIWEDEVLSKRSDIC